MSRAACGVGLHCGVTQIIRTKYNVIGEPPLLGFVLFDRLLGTARLMIV